MVWLGIVDKAGQDRMVGRKREGGWYGRERGWKDRRYGGKVSNDVFTFFEEIRIDECFLILIC